MILSVCADKLNGMIIMGDIRHAQMLASEVLKHGRVSEFGRRGWATRPLVLPLRALESASSANPDSN